MSTEHAILAVLSFKPSSGYDIKAEFEHEAAGLYWGMSYGSIYPKLKKLEEEGLIIAFEDDSKGRRKTLYELTRSGWAELERWLLKAPEYPVIKDELFMKMAVWHEGMDNNALISHLRVRRGKTLEILRFVKAWPENNTSYVSGIGKLAIRYARMRLEVELDWIDETIAALEKGNLPEPQDPSGMAKGIAKRRRRAMEGADIDEK
ncbi:PadR family transcriptional regulator [Neobacillus sp. YIM B06451]|uniref:PadR family transcriptional regulator n=1 Tax=Neobacillus sp. YIM B06451 TaxID=3070994 RepID=UPI00292FFED3|nr:PadR family transcriptional regulator [Neobacillus sp. YIM B06451]